MKARTPNARRRSGGALEFLDEHVLGTSGNEGWIMRPGSKFLHSFGVLSVLWSACAHAGSISVTVSGVIANGTTVLAAVCTTELEPSACSIGERKPASSSTMRFVFDGLAPGRYAIAAFQDLNGNGGLDRTKLGLPLEPFGFSNDAGRSGRPSFASAAFALGDGKREISLRLRGIARQTAPTD